MWFCASWEQVKKQLVPIMSSLETMSLVMTQKALPLSCFRTMSPPGGGGGC